MMRLCPVQIKLASTPLKGHYERDKATDNPIRGAVKDIDIKLLMDEWPYEPEQNIRMVRFSDGRALLQVRLPMGIEQFEVKGRPDGKTPHHMESALAYHEGRLKDATEAGIEAAFRLDHVACEELFEESTLYYLRYIRYLEIEDWERTLADTLHNLRLFDLVARYAEKPDDRLHLEQWRPYLMRVSALSAAMIQMKKKHPEKALIVLQEAVTRIRALPALDFESYTQEMRHSIAELNALLKRIRNETPPSPTDALEKQLQEAIRTEAYEKAALLRDQIEALRTKSNKRK
jgi:hypothetical protein